MPLAGMHITVTAAVLAAVRKFLKIRISNRVLLLGAAMGLLPDLDLPAAMVINRIFGTSFYFHKLYTHAAIIPIILFISAMVLKYFGKVKAAVITLVAASAWLVHLTLDCYIATGSSPTWIPAGGTIGFCREFTRFDLLVGFDAVAILLFALYLAYRSGKKD